LCFPAVLSGSSTQRTSALRFFSIAASSLHNHQQSRARESVFMEITGGPVATRDCGGTSALLPAERARAEFDVAKLHAVLSGTAAEVADQHAKWHQLFTEPLFDFTYGM